MSTIVMTIGAAFVTCFMQWWVALSCMKTLALLSGIEGTILLASAISPPFEDMEKPPKGCIRKIIWQFTEGARLNYPMKYNSLYFNLGLLLLTASFIFSALGDA